MGVFGGFYIVPLYALIQSRSREEERARVIAANNILNALLMVCSAILAIVMLSVLELSIPTLFLTISLLNVLVNGYIFKVVPEFSMRFLIWLLGHSMYRVEHRNLEAIPDEGPCVLVCNHVSFVDALLIGGAVRRPVRFVIDTGATDMVLTRADAEKVGIDLDNTQFLGRAQTGIQAFF